MSRFCFSAVLAVTLLTTSIADAQAVVPEDHPGFVLAEAIAEQGCVLHQDDVNAVLESAGLESPQFPQMAVPLMRDGYLAPSGEGTLTLMNWGTCTGDIAEEDAAVEIEADLEEFPETAPEEAADPEEAVDAEGTVAETE